MTPGEGPESETEPDEAPPERFAEDRFYRALATSVRRRALAHLLACESCTLEELVDVLCGWETATSRIVGPSQADRIRIELVHRHLPILEEATLIKYDRPTEEVTLEPLAPAVRRLIRQSIEAE